MESHEGVWAVSGRWISDRWHRLGHDVSTNMSHKIIDLLSKLNLTLIQSAPLISTWWLGSNSTNGYWSSNPGHLSKIYCARGFLYLWREPSGSATKHGSGSPETHHPRPEDSKLPIDQCYTKHRTRQTWKPWGASTHTGECPQLTTEGMMMAVKSDHGGSRPTAQRISAERFPFLQWITSPREASTSFGRRMLSQPTMPCTSNASEDNGPHWQHWFL